MPQTETRQLAVILRKALNEIPSTAGDARLLIEHVATMLEAQPDADHRETAPTRSPLMVPTATAPVARPAQEKRTGPGRPQQVSDNQIVQAIRESKGVSYVGIAKALKINPSTLSRRIRNMPAELQKQLPSK